MVEEFVHPQTGRHTGRRNRTIRTSHRVSIIDELKVIAGQSAPGLAPHRYGYINADGAPFPTADRQGQRRRRARGG